MTVLYTIELGREEKAGIDLVVLLGISIVRSLGGS